MNAVKTADSDLQVQRSVLEKARELDHLGRRVERFLSIQLQQLELALTALERERAAWERQRQAELEQLSDQRGQPLAGEAPPSSEAGTVGGKARWWSGWTSGLRAASSSATAAADRPAASPARVRSSLVPDAATDYGPVKMLIQPGSVGEFWLGALMMDISKLNFLLGGQGVRFEPVACRVPPRWETASSPDEAGSPIVELEIFSMTPLLEAGGRRGDSAQHSAALKFWERFRTHLMLASLGDKELADGYARASEAPRDEQCWATVVSAAHRAEHANDTLADTCPAVVESNADVDAPAKAQVRRIETVAKVIASAHGLRLHVSLV